MKHLALYLGIAASLVASCSIQDEIIETQGQDEVKFYASFEQPGDDGTKVYANENLLLRWNADDRVSIFNRVTYNQQYLFAGETGDNAGEFQIVNGDVFVTGNSISHVVSVYPYQKSTVITEDEVLTVTLPAEQTYAENTFGLGANTMVSVSSDNLLQYKNVGGYLMLKLYGEGVSVSSIVLKGNNGEKLAGKASITMPLGGVPTVVMKDDATTEIILSCETPVQLGATAEESTQFWFVVPPMTFSRGFSITVNCSDGVFSKTTDKASVIERNKLSKMAPIEIDCSSPVPIDLGLSVKWASFNLGASKPEEYGDYYSWGEIEPYDDQYSSDQNSFGDVLDPEHDAASVILGGTWRIPTQEEWTELSENCSFEWTSLNGIIGYRVYGKKNSAFESASIFLPAAGFMSYGKFYQVSTIYTESNYGDYVCSSKQKPEFHFTVSRRALDAWNLYDGRTIRPVCN